MPFTVAAYARVSTDHDEQDGSYETQVEYFTRIINANPDWEMVKIYADKGISGTCTARREDFKEMIKDALDGKINLILTKSISRFARNTVTTLETIRLLKEKGVAVIFEKENLRTDTCQGELMLTILSALAEQESRSISENIQWGIKAKFKEGKDVNNFCRFLGYGKGWRIIDGEAETVRMIYGLYLSGLGMYEICRELERCGRPRQDGEKRWHVGSISYILGNAAYCGDILLQKTFTVDFRGRIRKKNEGEVPMYYVENHHPGIVSRETYEKAQLEINRKKENRHADFSVSPFFGSIHTGECGNGNDSAGPVTYTYRRITTHSNNERWKRVIWKPGCKGGEKENCPTVSEDELYRIFHAALCLLSDKPDEIKVRAASIISEASSGREKALKKRDGILSGLKKLLGMIAEESDAKRHDALIKKYNTCLLEYDRLGNVVRSLEKREKCHERLTESLSEINEYVLSSEPDRDTLSCFYHGLDVSMVICRENVSVKFSSDIIFNVKIEKKGKSWSVA